MAQMPMYADYGDMQMPSIKVQDPTAAQMKQSMDLENRIKAQIEKEMAYNGGYDP